jgi:hypothetical protein
MTREEMTMKRYLVVLGVLTALALPAVVRAERFDVGSSAGTAASTKEGWVNAADLTQLLERKGLITPEEQAAMTHPNGTSSVDEKTERQYFEPTFSF